MCEKLERDIDLLIDDLKGYSDFTHECVVMYNEHLCKIKDLDYELDGNTLTFFSNAKWDEISYNTFQLLSLLNRIKGVEDVDIWFTAYDGTVHKYVSSYISNKYSSYGTNVRVIVVGDKTSNHNNKILTVNDDMDIEEGRMYEDKITVDFNTKI